MSEQDEAYTPDEPQASPEDRAFIESAGHKLNGLDLQPYSPERMWAADAMGLRYGRLTKEQTDQFLEDNTYPGMEGDVGIVIWLCSLTNIQEVHSARRSPTVAINRAIKFAIEHKMVSRKQKTYWDGYEVFLKMMREIHDAYGEPEGATQKKTVTPT
jgi:hypothetical protein